MPNAVGEACLWWDLGKFWLRVVSANEMNRTHRATSLPFCFGVSDRDCRRIMSPGVGFGGIGRWLLLVAGRHPTLSNTSPGATRPSILLSNQPAYSFMWLVIIQRQPPFLYGHYMALTC